MTWLPWVMLPLVGAVIGFATNWLAIKMLFHPRQKKLGLHGLMPRRQEELARQVGEVVATELLSVDQLLAPLEEVDLSQPFERLVDQALERKVGELRKIPLVGGMITDDRVQSIRDSVVKELIQAQPKIVEELRNLAQEKVDIAEMVRVRLAALDLDQLESVIHRVAKKEFATIELWGAVLGAIIGLAQAAILTLVPLAA